MPDLDAIVAYGQRAEELGYDSLWAWDHMFLGTGRPFPFLESLTTLTVLARETESVELGTGILVLPLRGAAVLAKTAATMEIISGGRLTLGMAVGWYEREFDACGVPFKQRGKIFEENLELMKQFWTGERVSGEARGIPFRNALMLPKPSPRQRPRLLIGGYVDKVLQRVAERSDGWLTYFYEPEAFSTAWQRIREHAEAAGRDPDALGNVAQLHAVHRRHLRGRRRPRAPVHPRLLRPARVERVHRRERDPRHARAVRGADRRAGRGRRAAHLPGPVRLRAGAGRAVRRRGHAAGLRPRGRRAMTGAADKRITLADAAALVRDGDTVVAGGCCYSRTPWAMLLELLRAQRRGLTLARNLMCYESELFLATGAAAKLVSSWVGIGLRWGIPKVFREYVERDPSIYEEWSHLRFGLRFMAASMGMPFLPTASLLGSDLLQRLPAQEMRCPFTDELLVAVPALVPDVALIHVHTVDAAGNAQIEGPAYMDVELARAAKTVIVTAEEVVPAEAIVRHNDRTLIPGFVVDAVVEVPFGSYPHECHGRYEADFAHFDAYAEQVAADGVAGVEAYLAEYVERPGSFAGFLDMVGASALLEQRRRARELVAA